MRTQLRTLLPFALSTALGCKPDADQQGVVVDLGEPRANSTVDRALEFGCVEFLTLTFDFDALPTDLYELRVAADGRQARCEFMLPFRRRRIHRECIVREYPNWKPKCPDYCGKHCIKTLPGVSDNSPLVCTGDLPLDDMYAPRDRPAGQDRMTPMEFFPKFMLTVVPDSLEFTLLRDGQVVRRDTIRPDYRLFAPNEGAAPVCRQASLHVAAKDAGPVEKVLAP